MRIKVSKRIPKENVSAILDDELEKFLDTLGVLNRFRRGKLKCKFCSKQITFENLHSIFPESGDIKTICNQSQCVRKVGELLRDGVIKL